ncbi:aldehyde dehydrogenase family protein [Salibacterium salarium]|uniref:aldehyde dehydrogenase family protein n=1 Tax=Salibacterium salarium TaxID=284579 RepID=UPI0027D8F435|nr:aldehyde dehydrogenase family protein [Salibacterium salarium]
MRVALELGDKNPSIIFGDSAFETAVDQVLNAVYFHFGQVCSAGHVLKAGRNVSNWETALRKVHSPDH